jgi:hypothetical protein
MAVDMEALMEELARVRESIESAGEEVSEEEGKAPSAQPENSTIKAIRAEAKRAEKRAAVAEAEAAELRKFKEETTERESKSILASAGLTPSQAQFYLEAGKAVTPEAVQAFKSEVLGFREAPEDEEGTAPAAPFAPAGFSSEKPPETIVGREALKAYVDKHGLEAATKAWEEGKLKV